MKTIVLCILFLPLTAPGQQQRKLTVDEAVQLALENNKGLHSSWTRVEAADARWSEVNASRLPSLKLQGSYLRFSDVDAFAVQVPFTPSPITISPTVLNAYSLRLTLQQPLFSGFRITSTINAAEYSAAAAQHDFDNVKVELSYATKAAYWNLFKAMEFKRVVTENVEQTKAHVADVNQLLKQGLATRNDVLKVDVQLSNLQLAEIDAASAIRLAMMGLNNIIGLPLETELQLSSPIEQTSEDTLPLPRLIQEALTSRFDMRSMESHLQASESLVKAARGGWYPQVFLIGNYYYARPNPRILPTRDEFKDTWDVGVNISFDLWNWMTPAHQSAQAEATLAQAQDALTQFRDGITFEVTQNYLEVKKAKEKLRVASRGVDQAEENHRITKSKFEAGVATNTDLLDTEVALLQTKTNNVTAVVDYELSKAKLAKSTGRRV